ncbi:hypothetical protein CVS29_15855 [Arthrobacter psychrochitiniphilus]|uniref:Uncharacterized protein n=2 Tax=Arthrobacter psychrochitiniphilus TaxID=291045 RepID=A0A2V3DPH1_9MICC|nr:hypothetical protein CVS29_15855 [Arthrobacter psychrochitiniphilus]
MQGVGVGVGAIYEDLLARFVAAENSREFVCVTVKSSMSAMRRFLINAGYLTLAVADGGPATPALLPQVIVDTRSHDIGDVVSHDFVATRLAG